MANTIDLWLSIGGVVALFVVYFILLRKSINTLRGLLKTRSFRQKLSSTFHQAGIYAKHNLWPCCGPEEDGTAARVQELITEHQIMTLTRCSAYFAWLLTMPVHINLPRFAAGGEHFWHPGQSVLVIIGALIQAVMAGSPSRLSRQTITVWFHVMMALLVLFGCLGVSFESFVLAGAISCFLRLPLCAFYLNAPSTIFWNLLSLPATFLSMRLHGFTLSTALGQFMAVQFVMVSVIVVVALVLGHIVYQAGLQQLELRHLERSNRAARGLLNMVCDLTINLDEKLVIVDESMALAAMLMHRPAKSLEGRKMEDFFGTFDDIRRFKAHVSSRQTASHEDQSIVTAFHCGLKDAAGSTIQVEAFVTMFRAMNGDTRYLLGIREFADEVHSDPSASRALQGDAAHNKQHRSRAMRGTRSQNLSDNLPAARGAVEAASDRSGSSSASSSSAGSDCSPMQTTFSVPNLRPTLRKAKDWVVVTSLMQVNWTLGRPACCSFHACVNSYISHLKSCLKRRCMHEFDAAAFSFGQCQSCGFVFMERCHTQLAPDCPVCRSPEMYPDRGQSERRPTISSI